MDSIVRLLWTVLVGWWFVVLWLATAVLLALLVIWYPLGLFMIANVWTVLTRKRPITEVIDDIYVLR
ncbi:hypothetical protein [Natranaeroarchaeum sulfidigenes]|uniref:Inner membrane component domain-containing protein n=1 Tax=Natranaeroarchaeum sulfidigenes TaxID=2784880 RepID=A0A897MV92_9EURY|nr:hypothetical protein [Natranaeroarchaeum sulfidigenes]QSG02165.1 hypothetical protein AArcS_0943 [Natranaeroarchaeum sulfidigenes]